MTEWAQATTDVRTPPQTARTGPGRSWRLARNLVELSLVLGLAAAAILFLPRAEAALTLLRAGDDPVAVADWHLAGRKAADYREAFAAAVAGADAELAESLADLAREKGVDVGPDAGREIAAARAAEKARAASDAWNGFVSGAATTETELAGSIAADLSGFGDIRDLLREARNHLAGRPVDTTMVALAAVGLGVTAVTVASFGSGTPAKAGVSTLKAASRAGRLSRPLAREVGRLAREAVDTRALGAVGKAVARLDGTAAKGAAGLVLGPGPGAAIRQLADDVTVVGRNTGYRGTLQVLARADDAAEVGRLARVSQRFGKATRGALVLLADGALTLGTVLVSAVAWLAGAVFWTLVAFTIVTRRLWRLGRWLGRSLARRPAPVAA